MGHLGPASVTTLLNPGDGYHYHLLLLTHPPLALAPLTKVDVISYALHGQLADLTCMCSWPEPGSSGSSAGVEGCHRYSVPPEASSRPQPPARVAGESQDSWRAFATRLATLMVHRAAALAEKFLNSAQLENENILDPLSQGSLPRSAASVGGCIP